MQLYFGDLDIVAQMYDRLGRYVDFLESKSCGYQSPYGEIASRWKRERGTFTWELTVPPNTTATVFGPARDQASVTEPGRPAAQAAGVKFLRYENGAAVFAVGSEGYRFASLVGEVSE